MLATPVFCASNTTTPPSPSCVPQNLFTPSQGVQKPSPISPCSISGNQGPLFMVILANDSTIGATSAGPAMAVTVFHTLRPEPASFTA